MHRSCRQCKGPFDITSEEIAFLEKVSPVISGQRYALPPPTLCPSCRQQRRWAMRNENNLYHRTCDLTKKPMISLYASDAPYTVYSEDAWMSDAWDPMNYGVPFDFLQSFFAQFNALMHRVPRRGMHQDGLAENSDYTAFGMNNKNCYLAFSCFQCEDVYCSSWMILSKICMDCFLCTGGELLYECAGCTNCYHTFFSQNCSNCQDSMLLEDCRNCHHCLCCKNLRGKEYHIYNKPVSKEAFEEKRAHILDGALEKEQRVYDIWKMTLPVPFARITQAENCSGNDMSQARHCIDCFNIQLGAEDCYHCQFCGWQAKDMMDCSSAGKNSEILYEMHATANTHRCAFDSFVGHCEHVYYSENMHYCTDCFGCIGLRHKQFCILNMQYTQQEYADMVSRIIEHMMAAGEWGEFFPITLSPFSYNETLAQEHFPMTKADVLEKGWRWKDVIDDVPSVSKSIPADRLPARIADVPDDVLNWAILSQTSGRPFRITRQELAFYRQQHLPLPRLHPDERHRRRMALRNPMKLWDRTCAKCQKPISTSYSPERSEIVYCEDCYLKEVY